jgi:UrcA family protein
MANFCGFSKIGTASAILLATPAERFAGQQQRKTAMFTTITAAAPRLLTTLAASGAVIATFALAPLAAHAATPYSSLADGAEAAVAAPVEHVMVDENGVPSLRVSYAGLDLSNATDRAEMNRRIQHAATRVCAPLRGATIEAERSVAYENCRSDAIRQAEADIDTTAAN